MIVKLWIVATGNDGRIVVGKIKKLVHNIGVWLRVACAGPQLVTAPYGDVKFI